MYTVSDVSKLRRHQDLFRALKKARRIMVITGAGISVAGGIPDFRSPGGLFDQMKNRFHGTIRKGQDLFDARWIDGIRLILEEQLRAAHEMSEGEEEEEEIDKEEIDKEEIDKEEIDKEEIDKEEIDKGEIDPMDFSSDFFDPSEENKPALLETPIKRGRNRMGLREGARIFLSFMAELKHLVDHAKPAGTHRFLKYLSDRKKLLRVYTQNIDCLEERVGLKLASFDEKCTVNHTRLDMTRSSSQDTELASSQFNFSEDDRLCLPIAVHHEGSMNLSLTSIAADEERHVVLLHGNLHWVVCTLCDLRLEFSGLVEETFRQGLAMLCPDCEMLQSIREAGGLRRHSIGMLRPDVVLYNESHPKGDWIASIFEADLKRKPDLLLIIGTSLKIPGCKQLIKKAAKSIQMRRGKVIFVNDTSPASPKEWTDIFDAHFIGDCDEIVQKLIRLLDEDYPKSDSCPIIDLTLETKSRSLKRRRSDSYVKDKPIQTRARSTYL
jgi:NAD-dependent histone deacetylase SIR2